MFRHKPFPARLHVIAARDAKSAVVIRRGPSKYTCVLSWNRENDEFKVAQWMKGKIYEECSDLSNDGKYFIYFALNGKWHRETQGVWTAISRAPWLKAIALFAKGNTWNGGGLFVSNTQYWVDGWSDHNHIRNTNEVRRIDTHPAQKYYKNGHFNVSFTRLYKYGWRPKKDVKKYGWKGMGWFEKNCLSIGNWS